VRGDLDEWNTRFGCQDSVNSRRRGGGTSLMKHQTPNRKYLDFLPYCVHIFVDTLPWLCWKWSVNGALYSELLKYC
jgi:hypothetical protein